MADEVEQQPIEAAPSRGRHIAKRALRNKALSITFDEKDLRNYVTGFHKRKKKRRKEARKQQEEAQRRKRIEERKKRRLERDIALYGGAPPAADSIVNGSDSEFSEEDEDSDPVPSVSGTSTYDNGDLKVTVTTSEISREDEAFPIEKIGERAVAQSVTAQRKHNVPVTKKKPFKRVARSKSRPKSHNRKDKKKAKKKGKKGR
ncbi:ribosomal RNA-processing protein 17 [Morus notabilis]|uniref:ribosomal RNA-processing protein 17 n=1 Tax=Morus notabilis TaxID=981085 RepID=UPI000CED7A0D|nr:ribosomal RNA-processing protein 17 [Morus notabilis]